MIAGGMESMSSSRHAIHMRPGVKFGDVPMEDTLLKVLLDLDLDQIGSVVSFTSKRPHEARG
jgi:hypothetical protein